MPTTANILIAALVATSTFTLIASYRYRELYKDAHKRWKESTARVKELRKEADSNVALVVGMMGDTRTTSTSGGIDGSRRYSMEFSYRSLGDLQTADAAWTQLSTNLTGLLRLATAKTGNDTYTYATDQLETLDHD